MGKHKKNQNQKSTKPTKPTLTKELQNCLGKGYAYSYTCGKHVYQMAGSSSLVIQSDLFMRQHMWHRLHPQREWSGQLLFKATTCNMLKYPKIVVDALDFIPYDLGSAVYTNIDLTNTTVAEITDYVPDFWDNEEYETEGGCIHKGVVHTHHGMSTFFSSTDQPNLINNASRFKGTMYVSLIVNHDYDWDDVRDRWKARIAWGTTPDKHDPNRHLLYYGQEVIGEATAPCVFWVECDVYYPYEAYNNVDRKRFKELSPSYRINHIENVTCKREFMKKFYLKLTQDRSNDINSDEFVEYLMSYSDLEEWFDTEFNDIVDELLAENDLNDIYTTELGLQINETFARVKIFQTLSVDIRDMSNVKNLKAFRKRLAPIMLKMDVK